MLKKIILHSIEVIGETKDAGSHLELFFCLRPDNGDKNTISRVPEKGSISVEKKVGSIALLDISGDVENVLSVTLMESDSSSPDENYGENAICAHSFSGFVLYGDKFRLNYITDRAS